MTTSIPVHIDADRSARYFAIIAKRTEKIKRRIPGTRKSYNFTNLPQVYAVDFCFLLYYNQVIG